MARPSLSGQMIGVTAIRDCRAVQRLVQPQDAEGPSFEQEQQRQEQQAGHERRRARS